MNVKGLLKTSLIDYPGEISSVVFLGGCNLRCKFCHNAVLASDIDSSTSIPTDEILNILEKRKNIISSIVISGGEPSIHDGLYAFINTLKSLSFKIKLDTNGLFPDKIEKLVSEKLIDYIALDIKTSPAKYKDLTGIDAFNEISDTLNIIKNSSVDYEIRTTCVPGYVDTDDFIEIGNKTGRVKKYFIQQFRNDTTLDSALSTLKPYTKEKLVEFKDFVSTFANICEIRGI